MRKGGRKIPKYEVKMKITFRENPIVVYADSKGEAEEKAVDVVLAWHNVDDAEAVEVEEV